MNKACGGDGIPAKLLQVLKNDAVKVPANLENSAVATGLEKDWKRSVFNLVPKKGNAREGSNYPTIALISHARKV